MNTINKQFATILTSPNKNLKRQICLDICQNITEYSDHIVFILQNIYKMLSTDNRTYAWQLVRSLRERNIIVIKCEFEYVRKLKKVKATQICYLYNSKNEMHNETLSNETSCLNDEQADLCSNANNDLLSSVNTSSNFLYNCNKLEINTSNLPAYTKVVLTVPVQTLTTIETILFLGASSKDYADANVDLATQKKVVSKIAGIDERFVKIDLIDAKDVAMKGRNSVNNTLKLKDLIIENVVDFFNAIMLDLIDSEWGKRHGAFGAMVELFRKDIEAINTDYIPVDINSGNKNNELTINANIQNKKSETIIEKVRYDSTILNLNNKSKSEKQTKPHGNTEKEKHYIIYKLPITLMNTILQVLFSDKFCDFTTDQITMPVREMAGNLLKNLFTHEYFVIDKLIDFLSISDWQIKCGTLITLHKVLNHLDSTKKSFICEKLTNLLETKDEDIIFYCAEILCELEPYIDTNRIKKICWESFNEGSEIAIGKKSIFKLLSVVYKKINMKTIKQNLESEEMLELPENIYNYFRSPISDVRSSIIEMIVQIYKYLNAPSRKYIARCIIENLLLEDNMILLDKNVDLLRNIFPDIPTCIIKHYLDVVSADLHKGYLEKDFQVKSENLLFSDSGVKLIGKDEVLKARIGFIKVILNYLFCSYDVSGYDIHSSAKESLVFNNNSIFIKNKTEKHEIYTEADYLGQRYIFGIIFYSFINLYYKYSAINIDPMNFFSSVPKGEFTKCLDSYLYNSHMPSINDNALLFYRLKMILTYSEQSILDLLEREKSGDYVDLISLALKLNNMIKLDLLKGIFKIIVTGKASSTEAVAYFFKNYYINTDSEFLSFLEKDSQSLTFLSTISSFLKPNMKSALTQYFQKALDDKQMEIIKYFIKEDFEYTEKLITYLLTINLNPDILLHVIDDIDFSYYVLFVKPLLKNISDPLTCTLFSRITPYLSLQKIHKNVTKYKEQIRQCIVEINGLFASYDYEMRVEIGVTLRDYQKRGVCWMAFLKDYGLNGVLADDMGLGKTVMVLAFLCNEVYKLRALEDKDKSSYNCKKECLNENRVVFDITDNKNEKPEINMKPLKVKKVKGRKNSNLASRVENLKRSGKLVNNLPGIKLNLPEIVPNHKMNQVLILTPGSLTGHWENEINTKFNYLTCAIYKKKAITKDVIITSFDQFRHDFVYFSSNEYFYLIVDEGHVLRNRETLLYKRIKMIKTQHKLVLTGTPVQNSVDDIFSLFNFLIPNFLGTEADFAKNYTSIISHARELRATERDQQKCEEALSKLRKTVGPFILRRLKADVLKDLPPKVVTDIILEFDDFERDAYESYGQAEDSSYGKKGFGKTIDMLKICSHKLYILKQRESRNLDLGKNIATSEMNAGKINGRNDEQSKVLEVSNKIRDGCLLQQKYDSSNLMQKDVTIKVPPTCNKKSGRKNTSAKIQNNLNETLKFKEEYVEADSDKNKRSKKDPNIDEDYLQNEKIINRKNEANNDEKNLSAKTKGLFDIITLCGDTNITHKIIVFTQFRTTIDYIISDLKTHKPFIKFVRIDGSTKPDQRAKIANTFNTSDTNIMFTTTATGGLGLNLTGADTVVMYEHDWNPFNDLQSMDRAHRIGQKKTVNVYRLLIKDTLEENIMNLQNFKMFVSGKIVDSRDEVWDLGDVVSKMGVDDV